MSHQSRLAARQNELRAAPNPLTFANKQAAAAPQRVSFEQVVPMLLAAGAARSCDLQSTTNPVPLVRITARCGPLAIPLDFTAVEAREFLAGLLSAVDSIDPPVVGAVDDCAVVVGAEVDVLAE
jgi:hypothetical protein